MTFDARNSKKTSEMGTATFGLITTAIVGGAFALVMFMPMPGRTSSSLADQTQDAAIEAQAASTFTKIPPAFKDSKSARKYFDTLSRFDQRAHGDILKRLSRASGKSQVDQSELVFMHAAEVLKAHGEDLSKAPTQHFDDILDMTRNKLRSAARANNPWCRGTRYAKFANPSLLDQIALEHEMRELEEPLRDYGFDVLRIMLDAAADGRDNPVHHGELTPRDEAAVQGVGMSLISDPDVMPLIMAAQRGDKPEDILRHVNACQLAATAITAFKTLPQDTKGRLFAELARDIQAGRSDFADFNSLYGF